MAQTPGLPEDWDDAHLIDVLADLHEDDATLGYRFLTDELDLEHSIRVGENRVHRLCRIAGITASHHKKRTKAGSAGPAAARRPPRAETGPRGGRHASPNVSARTSAQQAMAGDTDPLRSGESPLWLQTRHWNGLPLRFAQNAPGAHAGAR